MLTTCEKIVADIPCFEIAVAGEEPLAELVLYHGWGSNAEKQRFRGQLLAAFGYRVIVPEISGHGVRGALAYDGPQAALDFQRVLLQSVGECVELAQAVFHPGRAHFLVGHSLGGMIALGALTPLARALNGVVAMNSTANWADATAALAGGFATVARRLQRWLLTRAKSCSRRSMRLIRRGGLRAGSRRRCS